MDVIVVADDISHPLMAVRLRQAIPRNILEKLIPLDTSQCESADISSSQNCTLNIESKNLTFDTSQSSKPSKDVRRPPLLEPSTVSPNILVILCTFDTSQSLSGFRFVK